VTQCRWQVQQRVAGLKSSSEGGRGGTGDESFVLGAEGGDDGDVGDDGYWWQSTEANEVGGASVGGAGSGQTGAEGRVYGAVERRSWGGGYAVLLVSFGTCDVELERRREGSAALKKDTRLATARRSGGHVALASAGHHRDTSEKKEPRTREHNRRAQKRKEGGLWTAYSRGQSAGARWQS
jgi:hypothetical protein